jgi:hypothetical protein
MNFLEHCSVATDLVAGQIDRRGGSLKRGNASIACRCQGLKFFFSLALSVLLAQSQVHQLAPGASLPALLLAFAILGGSFVAFVTVAVAFGFLATLGAIAVG